MYRSSKIWILFKKKDTWLFSHILGLPNTNALGCTASAISFNCFKTQIIFDQNFVPFVWNIEIFQDTWTGTKRFTSTVTIYIAKICTNARQTFWGTKLQGDAANLILAIHFLYRICIGLKSSVQSQTSCGSCKVHIKPSSFEEHPDSYKALIHDGFFWTLSNNWHIPLVRMGLQSLFPPRQSNELPCTFHNALNLSSPPPN